jgi:exodeoxyribonuclease VII large subunit
MAAAPRVDWLASLQGYAQDLTRAMRRRASDAAQTLDWLSRRLVSPAAYTAHQRLKLHGMQLRLAHATRTPLNLARFAVAQLDTRLRAQMPDIVFERRRLSEQARRLQTQTRVQQHQRRQMLAALSSQLEMLNPQRTLERGYAIVTDSAGKVVRSPVELRVQERLNMRLAEGSADIMLALVQPTQK